MSTTTKTRSEYAQEILRLADDMASSACSLNPQTYETFIDSRSKLKEVLKQAFAE
jgi:hypothetical protein